ncbi:MAG TPA: hypothetical protein VHL57_02390 [Flavobacteriales bacterium]|nr:hypothetical protein [Flavobacteriales bacterium]
MTDVAYIIPFRDRGTDPLRYMNLQRTREHWTHATEVEPMIAHDGRSGDKQFNRSSAYNYGVRAWEGTFGHHPEVYVFIESDMLVLPSQIRIAIEWARKSPGLVVPFIEYRALGPDDSELVRCYFKGPQDCPAHKVIANGRSHGAVNVISRTTLDMIGQYDEGFEGNWYDDDAMKIAFEVCTGVPTRFTPGMGWHLYHQPGHAGAHLSDADRDATTANKERLGLYQRAARSNNVAEIRRLLKGEA